MGVRSILALFYSSLFIKIITTPSQKYKYMADSMIFVPAKMSFFHLSCGDNYLILDTVTTVQSIHTYIHLPDTSIHEIAITIVIVIPLCIERLYCLLGIKFAIIIRIFRNYLLKNRKNLCIPNPMIQRTTHLLQPPRTNHPNIDNFIPQTL